MQNFKKLLIKNKQNLIVSKINLNYYHKQYLYYIIGNTFMLNLKHFEIKLNNIYKLFKYLLIENGQIGFLGFLNTLKYFAIPKNKVNLKKSNNILISFFKNYNQNKEINNFFKKTVNIHNIWRGGYFTTNFYLKKKELSDLYIFGDISLNSYYIFNEIVILKKPIISFIRFDYKNFNLILYKLFGNFSNNNVLFFYKKLLYYFIYKSMIYKKINFYYYFL